MERLISALTPKHLHPAPIESAKRLRYRLAAAESLMLKCQEELASEIAKRAVRFGDDAMGHLASDMAEGLTTDDLNEGHPVDWVEEVHPTEVFRLLKSLSESRDRDG